MAAATQWHWQQQSRTKVLQYAFDYYGIERPSKIVVRQSQHWNDDGYSDDLYIDVYGAKNRKIGPDLTLPAWKGIDKDELRQAAYDDDIISGAREYLHDEVLESWDLLVPFVYKGVEDDGRSEEAAPITLTYYVSDPNKGAPLTCFVYEPLKEVRSADLEG